MKKAKSFSMKSPSIDIMHLHGVLFHFHLRFPGQVIALLIDLIDIPKKLLVPMESLYLHKLFSIVVENLSMVQEVIKINKELGGGRITVIPLSVDQGERSFLSKTQNVSVSQIADNIDSNYEQISLRSAISAAKPDQIRFNNCLSLELALRFLVECLPQSELAMAYQNLLSFGQHAS